MTTLDSLPALPAIALLAKEPGRAEDIRRALSKGAEANFICKRGHELLSPLAIALRAGSAENALALLEALPSAPLISDKGSAGAFTALADGFINKGWDARFAPESEIPLFRQLAAELASHGSDINERDASGHSGLTLCAEIWGRSPRRSESLLRLMVSLGADINGVNFLGETPLRSLVIVGESLALGVCLELGADDAIPARDGSLPLFAAFSTRSQQSCLLLARNASPAVLAARDRRGRSALGIACSASADAFKDQSILLEIIDTLASRGGDFFEPNALGERPVDLLLRSELPALKALGERLALELHSCASSASLPGHATRPRL